MLMIIANPSNHISYDIIHQLIAIIFLRGRQVPIQMIIFPRLLLFYFALQDKECVVEEGYLRWVIGSEDEQTG